MRATAAVDHPGACARGGPAVGARVAEPVSGWVVMAARRGLGKRVCLLEETLRRPTTVQGGIRRATPESGAVVGEAGACRREGLLRAGGPPPPPLGSVLALRLAEIRGSRDLGQKKKNVPVRNKLSGYPSRDLRVRGYALSLKVSASTFIRFWGLGSHCHPFWAGQIPPNPLLIKFVLSFISWLGTS